MNDKIMQYRGFNQEVKDKENSICPFCKKKIIDVSTEFRDQLSKIEYEINGLCQQCQDDFFK